MAMTTFKCNHLMLLHFKGLTSSPCIDSETQLAGKCLFTSRDGTLTHKVGQTDLVFGRDHSSFVGLCTQDYKSLCVQQLRS